MILKHIAQYLALWKLIFRSQSPNMVSPREFKLCSARCKKIVELELTPSEKKQFLNSVKAVRNLTNLANKLLKK